MGLQGDGDAGGGGGGGVAAGEAPGVQRPEVKAPPPPHSGSDAEKDPNHALNYSQWPQYCAAALALEAEAVQSPSPPSPASRSLCAACCASLANGMSYGWPSVAQPQLQAAGGLDDEEASWLASLLYLSSAAGVLPCAWLFPRVGRKSLGYAAGTCLGLQWLLLYAGGAAGGAAGGGAPLLMAARTLAGAAGALLFFFTPAYVREVAEERVRGTLGTFMSLLFNCGVLLVYFAGGLLSYQGLNLLALCVTALFLLGFWRMPDTPVQLLALGRTQDAREALQWLRGAAADVTEEFRWLEGEVKRRQAEDAASLAQLLADRASAKGLLLAFLLCANQPLCGFFVVLSYAVPIFTAASPAVSAHAAACAVGLLLVLGSLAASRLVERTGRRRLLLASDAAMAACLAALGAHAYAQASGADVSWFAWVPVAALSLFMASVSLAVTTLPFVVITEIFLPQAQRLATALGAVTILALGFLATKFFGDMSAALGLHGTYWLFACACAAFAVCYLVALPETKGRSLESIREELAGGKAKGGAGEV